MHVIDSCGWLEYFTDGPLADKYYPFLRRTDDLIVPTVVIYEVYKKIKRETTEEQALLAVGQMQSATVLPLKMGISLLAADLSLKHDLPMADALVYASARSENATLVTGDKHFENLEGVTFIR